MTLSELVPSLDLCQQLKAAGFSQDTAFGWHKHIRVWGDGQFDDEWDWFLAEVCPRNADDFLCAAPTAGELEEWLRARKPNASMTITSCNGDVPTINVDVDDDVVGLHKGVGQYQTLVSALAALVLEVAG